MGPMLSNFLYKDFANVVFVPNRPLQPCKCLWVRLGAYPRAEQPKCASLLKVPALGSNIRLSWNDLSVTNTLA